jgi:hypothetical protein
VKALSLRYENSRSLYGLSDWRSFCGASFTKPEQLTLSLSSTPALSPSDASRKNLVGAWKGGFVVFSTRSRELALTGERTPVDFPGPGYRRMLENPE